MHIGTVQHITDALLDEMIREARRSPRLRAIRRLHSGDWEHSHRMLNALIPGTYVRPHLHPDSHQGEGFILLRGSLAVLVFDDLGSPVPGLSRLLEREAGSIGMDIAPNTWHTLVALGETVIYETKGQPPGGYLQSRDKVFAPWAPEEGAEEAAVYLAGLVEAAAGLGS